MSAHDLYLAELAHELDLEDFDSSSTVVRIEPDRAGSNLIVGYAAGDRFIVRAAPEHEAIVQALASDSVALSFDGLRQWAETVGWVDFDGGRSHVIERSDLAEAAVPYGLDAVRLRPNVEPDTADRVRAFLSTQDPEDVDAADIYPDELDDRMFGLEASGRLVALASSLVYDQGPSFEDIGILVAPSVRRRGVARALVGTLANDIFDDGAYPLYRCNWSNEASRRVALSLGFNEVLSLIALCPADDPRAQH